MAIPPQGTFSFPGVKNVLHGSIGLGHGTTPNVCMLYIAPQDISLIQEVGTLTIRYGSFTRIFKNCRCDFMNSDIGNDGKKVWQLVIMTRQWKWKVGPGKISGFYNHKIAPNSDQFIAGRERDPRELAELCLKAMGEKSWSGMNNLPLEPRPETEWDCEQPAQVLNNLIEQFGCRICLDKQERVKIIEVGKGRSLPGGGTVLTRGDVLNPPERPDEIIAAMAHTLIQGDLRLIAVGLDVDGGIRPIDALSYKPAGGWIKVDPHKFNNVSDPLHKDFARATVFRWYQIATPFSFRLSPTGQLLQINSLENVLPLRDIQIDKTPSKGPNVNRQSLPPWVYGIFYQGKERDRNNVTQLLPNAVQANKRAGGFYGGSFEVDRERGIVKFAEPVYSYIPATAAQPSAVRQANLRLRIAFPFRNGKELEFHRYERKRQTKGKKYGTQPRVEKREEIGLTCVQRYDNNFNITNVETNIGKVKAYADYHLDAIEREYQTLTPETKSYAGFVDLELDGRIRQIVYKVDERGAATTEAAADNEGLLKVPPYRFLRDVDAMEHALAPKPIPSKAGKMAEAAAPRAEQSASFTAAHGAGGGTASFTPGGA